MIDYKLIEAVSAVLQCGGFDKAAQKLSITQSAVSQRVRLLETRLAQPLVVRTSPPTPTAAGLRLLRHYQQVQTLEQSMFDDLSPELQGEYKTLSLAVNADSLATWLLPSVAAFCRQQQVLLNLNSADESVTLEILRKGEVIGCISSVPDPIQGCRALALGRMNYIAVARPDFISRHFPEGVNADNLKLAPTVAYNRDDRLQDQYLQKHFGIGAGEFHQHLLPSTQSFVEAALEGMAYVLVPRLQVQHHLDSNRLQEIASGRVVYSDLFWHYWNIQSPLLEQFTSTLIQGAKISMPT